MSATNAGIYYGCDRSTLGLANVNEINDTGADPTLGGTTYADIGRWWTEDRQRNHSAGATLTHAFGRIRLDVDWHFLDARGTTTYRFETAAALAYFGDGENDLPAFQYVLGRQCASVSLSQCQVPACAGVEVTVMCFSNAALSVTGTSKVTITGMPTPTVSPGSGATEG